MNILQLCNNHATAVVVGVRVVVAVVVVVVMFKLLHLAKICTLTSAFKFIRVMLVRLTLAIKTTYAYLFTYLLC